MILLHMFLQVHQWWKSFPTWLPYISLSCFMSFYMLFKIYSSNEVWRRYTTSVTNTTKLVKLLWTMRDKVKEKVKARFKIKVKVINPLGPVIIWKKKFTLKGYSTLIKWNSLFNYYLWFFFFLISSNLSLTSSETLTPLA